MTDEERGIVNAVSTTLPGASSVRCWNHSLRDVTRLLRGHGATTADISVYLADVKNVFHQASEDDYKKNLMELAEKWSVPFHEYYMDHIERDISSIARWGLQPLGI